MIQAGYDDPDGLRRACTMLSVSRRSTVSTTQSSMLNRACWRRQPRWAFPVSSVRFLRRLPWYPAPKQPELAAPQRLRSETGRNRNPGHIDPNGAFTECLRAGTNDPVLHGAVCSSRPTPTRCSTSPPKTTRPPTPPPPPSTSGARHWSFQIAGDQITARTLASTMTGLTGNTIPAPLRGSVRFLGRQ